MKKMIVLFAAVLSVIVSFAARGLGDAINGRTKSSNLFDYVQRQMHFVSVIGEEAVVWHEGYGYEIPTDGIYTNNVICKEKFEGSVFLRMNMKIKGDFIVKYKAAATDKIKSAFEAYGKFKIATISDFNKGYSEFKEKVNGYYNAYANNGDTRIVGKVKSSNTNDWDMIVKQLKEELKEYKIKYKEIKDILQEEGKKVLKELESVEWEKVKVENEKDTLRKELEETRRQKEKILEEEENKGSY